MKSFKPALAFVACALASSMSYAEPTAHVLFDNPIFNGSGVDGVKLKYSPASGTGVAVSLNNVGAGRFQGTVVGFTEVQQSIFVDGLKDLYMYCYDIHERIWDGAEVFDYKIKLDGDNLRTLDFLGAVNSVLSGSSDPFAWLHSSNISQRGVAAAIQLGIWESKYETDGNWDLGLGIFSASELDADTLTWWGKFKGALGSDSLDAKYVMVLEKDGVQDMITGDPVPEPGTLALLGLALGGLAFAPRKRAKRAV